MLLGKLIFLIFYEYTNSSIIPDETSDNDSVSGETQNLYNIIRSLEIDRKLDNSIRTNGSEQESKGRKKLKEHLIKKIKGVLDPDSIKNLENNETVFIPYKNYKWNYISEAISSDDELQSDTSFDIDDEIKCKKIRYNEYFTQKSDDSKDGLKYKIKGKNYWLYFWKNTPTENNMGLFKNRIEGINLLDFEKNMENPTEGNVSHISPLNDFKITLTGLNEINNSYDSMSLINLKEKNNNYKNEFSNQKNDILTSNTSKACGNNDNFEIKGAQSKELRNFIRNESKKVNSEENIRKEANRKNSLIFTKENVANGNIRYIEENRMKKNDDFIVREKNTNNDILKNKNRFGEYKENNMIITKNLGNFSLKKSQDYLKSYEDIPLPYDKYPKFNVCDGNIKNQDNLNTFIPFAREADNNLFKDFKFIEEDRDIKNQDIKIKINSILETNSSFDGNKHEILPNDGYNIDNISNSNKKQDDSKTYNIGNDFKKEDKILTELKNKNQELEKLKFFEKRIEDEKNSNDLIYYEKNFIDRIKNLGSKKYETRSYYNKKINEKKQLNRNAIQKSSENIFYINNYNNNISKRKCTYNNSFRNKNNSEYEESTTEDTEGLIRSVYTFKRKNLRKKGFKMKINQNNNDYARKGKLPKIFKHSNEYDQLNASNESQTSKNDNDEKDLCFDAVDHSNDLKFHGLFTNDSLNNLYELSIIEEQIISADEYLIGGNLDTTQTKTGFCCFL